MPWSSFGSAEEFLRREVLDKAPNTSGRDRLGQELAAIEKAQRAMDFVTMHVIKVAAGTVGHGILGIVGSARDPWGNTLLWNTFANRNSTPTLRTELLRLGCDPRAENEWGLSYQLVRDNILDKYRDIKLGQKIQSL